MESLPIERDAPVRASATPLADAVADHVGRLLANTERAAEAMRQEATADAQLIVQTATHEAVDQARAAMSAMTAESVPQLEARVTELRELADSVRAEIDRLTDDLSRIAAGEIVAQLPPAAMPPPTPPVRTAEDRRALLIALNMANNGASRDEAKQYLVENVGVIDPETFLDAVYGPA